MTRDLEQIKNIMGVILSPMIQRGEKPDQF